MSPVKYLVFVLALLVLLNPLRLIAQQMPWLAWSAAASALSAASPNDIPDATADRVLGQVGFATNTSGLSASTLNGPAGVAIAPNDRLFVVDYHNNRVLSWPSAAAFQSGAAADLVLGQPNFNSMTGATSQSNLNAPESVAVDASGNLWVADSYNMRVVRFSPPFANGMNANLVLGQADFSGSEPNRGQSTPSAGGLWFPRGLAFDQQGRLYVADPYNNRVLRFDPPFTNGKDAALVVGQANFTSGTANRDGQGAKNNGFWTPTAVAIDATGNLYVADRDNNRVLRFDAPLTNGKAANALFGQASFTSEPSLIEACIDNPYSTATPVIGAGTLSEPLDLALTAAGDLLVSDICFHRVLLYQNPAGSDTTADFVYGQPDFTSGQWNRGNSQPAADTLATPLGLAVSNSGAVYVADFENHRILAYDVPAAPTPTNTPPPTATSTDTAPATATPTATPTTAVTPDPTGNGDAYEADNSCPQASTIALNGVTQARTFHQAGDVDWVRFPTSAGVTYRIEVNVPTASRADVDLELYANCDSVPTDKWNASFTPSVRLDFTPPADGAVYLRLANYDTTVAGNDVSYQLAVYPLVTQSTNRALIIVAGRLRGTDRLQPNIHAVTEAVYRLFQRNGYDDEHIQYLATDSRLAGYDAAASKTSLKAAITQWAAQQLKADGALTLYMIDHGNPDLFYIDDVSGQRLTPTELNEWLTELESTVTGVKINVIIEACQSGSFITNPQSISKAGRVIITSTNDRFDAKASRNGAYFSDHLLTWLHQGYNLSASFVEARTVAKGVFTLQDAWLDANGNGIANEFEDAALAAQRSFAYEGTLSGDDWPPHIFSAQGPTTITNFKGVIQADVRDNVKVRSVWAVVYPPDYQPPATGQELQAETLPTFLLSSVANGDVYAGDYPGFTQPGLYRIVIHAEDSDGLVARPVVIEVNNGAQLFLPLVVR